MAGDVVALDFRGLRGEVGFVLRCSLLSSALNSFESLNESPSLRSLPDAINFLSARLIREMGAVLILDLMALRDTPRRDPLTRRFVMTPMTFLKDVELVLSIGVLTSEVLVANLCDSCRERFIVLVSRNLAEILAEIRCGVGERDRDLDERRSGSGQCTCTVCSTNARAGAEDVCFDVGSAV